MDASMSAVISAWVARGGYHHHQAMIPRPELIIALNTSTFPR